jgi:hypothetical protein
VSILVLSVFLSQICTANEQKLIIGCSDWKPYCYFSDGQLTGSAYQLMQQILTHNQRIENQPLDYSFAYIPWNRIYRLTLKNPNYLIMGLGRTAKREDLFNWILPLRKPTRIFFYQLKKNASPISRASDLLNFRLAVERGAFTQDYLLELGYSKEKLITVSRMDQLLKMALHGRIDGFLLDEKVFAFESAKNNINPAQFDASFLAFEVTEYLAAHKKLSPRIIHSLQQSYRELIAQDNIQLLD